MLAINIYTSEVSENFRRFAEIVGDKHWRQRVQQCKQEIRGNDLLREYLLEQNDIAFQLDMLSSAFHKYGMLPEQHASASELHPAISLIAQSLSIMDNFTPKDAERFRRRLHGALKNPPDMRGLRLELTVATHFALRGCQIAWPEIIGAGTFDLLVEGESGETLEVECKSIGEDKGRRIHRHEAIVFASKLRPLLRPMLTGLNRGLSVVLTVPDRLPAAHKEQEALAKELSRTILAGQDSILSNGAQVRLTEFDAQLLGANPEHDISRLRAVVDGVTGTENCSVVTMGIRNGGALALVLQSRQDDQLLKSVFDTLSDAARRQLTGTRAGLLLAGFDAIEEAQIFSLAAQDDNPGNPTALRVAVSRFISSELRDHVIGAGFVSRTTLRPSKNGVTASGGAAYFFPKTESRFWSDGFNNMFD